MCGLFLVGSLRSRDLALVFTDHVLVQGELWKEAGGISEEVLLPRRAVRFRGFLQRAGRKVARAGGEQRTSEMMQNVFHCSMCEFRLLESSGRAFRATIAV